MSRQSTPLRVPGPDRLHAGLLRREPPGDVRHRILASAAIGQFLVGEDARQEPVAVSFDGRSDPREVGGVHADAHDGHRATLQCVPIPLETMPSRRSSLFLPRRSHASSCGRSSRGARSSSACRSRQSRCHGWTTRELAIAGERAAAKHSGISLPQSVAVERVLARGRSPGARRSGGRRATRSARGARQADGLVSRDPSICSPSVSPTARRCSLRTGASAPSRPCMRDGAARRPASPGPRCRACASCIGSRAGDLVAALGPSIGPCCYGVGDGTDRCIPRRTATATRTSIGGSCAGDGLRLDLWAANRDQLEAAGIPATRRLRERPLHRLSPGVVLLVPPGGCAAGRRRLVELHPCAGRPLNRAGSARHRRSVQADDHACAVAGGCARGGVVEDARAALTLHDPVAAPHILIDLRPHADVAHAAEAPDHRRHRRAFASRATPYRRRRMRAARSVDDQRLPLARNLLERALGAAAAPPRVSASDR